MHFYGIRGICYRWFKSYLSDWEQFLRLDDCVSDVKFVESGVPQGSILGPLLFLIFINDVVNCLKMFKFVLFADDSNLLYSFYKNDVESVVPVLNAELNKLHQWLLVNKLKLNLEKTKYTVFSYRKDVILHGVKLDRFDVSLSQNN